MSSPLFNYFYRVELTVANYALGDIKPGSTAVREVVTKTYNFVNKRVKDASTSAERETYIPTLRSVGEVTLSAGEILPTSSFSSVSLDDSRGSFGRDRRFSDLLERSTIIGQPINFYIGEAPLETDAPPSWQLIGSGLVASWTKALSGESAEITIQIQPSKISEKVMNIEVSRDIPGMENAPDSSIGKVLPVTFCRARYNPRMQFPGQEVTPTRISADGASNAKYALTTQMYQTTKALISPYIFVKKNWPESTFEWLGMYFPPPVVPNYTTPRTANTYTLNQYAASAYRIPEILKISDSEGFIITSVTLAAKGQSTNPVRVSNAYLSVFILLVDKVNYTVIEELGRGRAALANYDANNNVLNSTFFVTVSLDRPVVVDLTSTREYDFYIGFEATDVVAGQEMALHQNATGAPHRRLVKERTAAAGDSFTEWKIVPDNVGIIAHSINYVNATFNEHETLFTPDGFTYSSLSLTQFPADVGQVNPSLDNLQLITHVEGFTKYPFSERLEDPQEVIKILSYQWDGETWEDKNTIDSSTLLESHYAPLFATGVVAPGSTNLGGQVAIYLAYPTPAWTSYTTGDSIIIVPNLDNDAAPSITINVSSIGFVEIRLNGLVPPASTLRKGIPIKVTYDGTYFQIIEDYESHRARVLGGIIEARSNYAQVLSEIARGTASKIGILSDGKLFIYPWGITAPLEYIIPQEDIIPLSWETRDEATIVNRAQVLFERGFLNSQQDGGSFNYSIDFSSAAYSSVQFITERSRSIYGVKNVVENSFPVFGFSRSGIGTSTLPVGLPGYLTGGATDSTPGGSGFSPGPPPFSVDFLADYYISRFALPFVYCSFVVPYHRYKDIRMFDVISFHHSEFPAFFGTDPYARPGAVDDGTSVTLVPEANNGEEFVRAKSYRGLVEAVSYVMAMEHAPAIRLTVQVLINTEFDPT